MAKKKLHDEMVGDVEIVDYNEDGWPMRREKPRRGPNSSRLVPILYGGLVEAVCTETIGDVAKRWHVPQHLVKQWRIAIAGTDKNVQTALAIRARKTV